MNDTATTTSAGVVNFSTGTVTGDGTAIVVTLGFKPRHIRAVNVTDVEVWDKFESMTDAQALKTVTAGTTTIDTGSAIVISDNGFTLLAAEFGTSDVIHWAAWG
jgi:hypothetical protein